MGFCEHCKNDNQTTNACAYCGSYVLSGNGSFVFGNNMQASVPCTYYFTNRYLIIGAYSAKEQQKKAIAGVAFGAIGMLASEAVGARKTEPYGFYDLRECAQVIFPCCVKGAEKVLAVRFINRDGTDFALAFTDRQPKKQGLDLLLQTFQQTGMQVVSEPVVYNSFCVNPLVDSNTYNRRICYSAGGFVRRLPEQFIAPQIDTGAQVSYSQSPPSYGIANASEQPDAYANRRLCGEQSADENEATRLLINQPSVTDPQVGTMLDEQTIKKRKNRRLFFSLGGIAICLVILVVTFALKGAFMEEEEPVDLSALASLAEQYTSSSSRQDDTSAANSTDTPETMPFSYGSIENNVYSNQWANLRFDMGENWVEAPQEAYDTYYTDTTSCDFYCVNAKSHLIAVVFTDISSMWEIDLYSDADLMQDYIEVFIEQLGEPVSQNTEETVFAGQTYQHSDLLFSNNVCFSIYLRRQDDYIITCLITGEDARENVQYATGFQPLAE